MINSQGSVHILYFGNTFIHPNNTKDELFIRLIYSVFVHVGMLHHTNIIRVSVGCHANGDKVVLNRQTAAPLPAQRKTSLCC